MRIHSPVHLVLLAGLGGCFIPIPGGGRGGGSSGGGTTPDSDEPAKLDGKFGSYVAVLRKEDSLGRLPTDLDVSKAAVDPSYHAAAGSDWPMSIHRMYFDKLSAGRICLLDYELEVPLKDSAEELGQDRFTRYEYWIEAVDSLEAVANRPLWPSPGTRLDSVEVASDETEDDVTESGVVLRKREVKWRLCGPAPAVTAQTHYLAVAFKDGVPQSKGAVDGLLLWEIADGPRPE